ncbi:MULTISPECIES: hypothetical protein [unclassified Mesorhizobium]|uniref:phage adaptor protein n=1 Tax=unclassified Mesorhizobium TaxID=325217 RepID=UPI000FCCC2CD|nr:MULTISPECIES: hypothetical protein [unclassified Mesorhizobium]RUV16958.1 hypothetical protein EOA91_19575 [Mesorhizobium sp. M1A.F.Ca.IN.022.04.1.1]RWG29739.1 MAG: hypothetical protein EOQ60_20380 [Mesorhizobium sp.]
MSLLTIVQGAALRVGLPQPATAIASPDTTIQQLVAFAQDAGDDLQERWKWRNLKSANVTFTGDGVTATFPLPADFDTLSPSDTFVSSAYPTLTLPGPVNEDDLLRMKAVPVTVQPSCWRLIGGNIEFYPVLGAGEIVTYVYASAPWILDANGTTRKLTWAADTDTSLISERLIRLGCIWMWKRAKGLDYAEEFNTYERSFNINAGQEDTDRVIDTSNSPQPADSWWPGTITYTGP